jgi:aspartate aminotransferase
MKPADRISRLNESQTIAMARKSRELIASGVDIISLSLGEPDFHTPEKIKEAAKKAIDDNFSYYTHVSGYLELREAISQKFKRDNGLDYSADQIVVSTGAKQSIANAVLSLINPGDEVLVPAPYWVSYLEIIKMAEGIPVVIPTGISQDFKVRPADLEKHLSPKTRMCIFSSPCNPTGSVYSREELQELAGFFAKHKNIFIVSDEIYEHINFVGKHTSIASFPEVYDQTITVNGVSKAFAMTGWRVGYMGAPAWIAKACDKMQGQFTSATCSIAQKATLTAVLMDPKEIEPMKTAFFKRKELCRKLLAEIPGFRVNDPGGAFYFFPEVSALFGKSFQGKTINNGTDLSMYLLEQAHVALVPGAAFGDDNYIRFSYATSEERLKKAIERMKKAIETLS